MHNIQLTASFPYTIHRKYNAQFSLAVLSAVLTDPTKLTENVL